MVHTLISIELIKSSYKGKHKRFKYSSLQHYIAMYSNDNNGVSESAGTYKFDEARSWLAHDTKTVQKKGTKVYVKRMHA